MNIHEYQAKAVLRELGVPVARGIAVFNVGDAVKAAEELGGPVWVVKAQIHAGGRGEALWHYKNGMVKCAPARPVKDCTERTNLRRYGTGDFFFSYRDKVCVSRVAKSKSVDLSSTNWDGGVGDGSN